MSILTLKLNLYILRLKNESKNQVLMTLEQ